MILQASRVFPARMDAFPRVEAFAVEIAAAAGFDRQDCLRLTLILEELFTNTVAHGYSGDAAEPVSVTCEVQPGRVALTYEDTGPPFDPFGAVRRLDDALGIEERPVGGLGLRLVAGLAGNLEYSHAHGRNRISLVMSGAG